MKRSAQRICNGGSWIAACGISGQPLLAKPPGKKGKEIAMEKNKTFCEFAICELNLRGVCCCPGQAEGGKCDCAAVRTDPAEGEE